jgi:hypothetical protein
VGGGGWGHRCYPGAIEGNSIKHEPQGRESAALAVCCLTFLFFIFSQNNQERGHDPRKKKEA